MTVDHIQSRLQSLVSYLVQTGAAEGLGLDVFLGSIPDSPDSLVWLKGYPAPSLARDDPSAPLMVQILVRANTSGESVRRVLKLFLTLFDAAATPRQRAVEKLGTIELLKPPSKTGVDLHDRFYHSLYIKLGSMVDLSNEDSIREGSPGNSHQNESSSDSSRSLEDQLIHEYFAKVGGKVYLDVTICSPYTPDKWPAKSKSRRADAVRLSPADCNGIIERPALPQFQLEVERAQKIQLIEARRYLDRYLFGQLIAGRDIFERQFGRRPDLLALCRRSDPAMEWVYAKHDVHYLVLKAADQPKSEG